MPALPAMRNSIYSAQIAETAWRKSRAEQDWDGSEFPKLTPVPNFPGWSSLIELGLRIHSLRFLARTQPMTTLLAQAIDQLRKCSPAEQDTIAALILEEIADDTRWEEAFAASRPEIEQLAERVRAKIRSGQTRDMRIDDL